MKDIGKYEHRRVEERWLRFWKERRLFHVREPDPKKKFSVVIPPPNVTGSLHMGHALNITLQDVIVRWKRMRGYDCVWVPGFDHAGIATQYVVEKNLKREGKSRFELGREKFLEEVWKWIERTREAIREQVERIGASVDWERERFTLDEGFSKLVRDTFKRLYEDGLIYRGEYLINWCVQDRTALSDLEVEHQEEEGYLYYIKYPLEGGGYIEVATTRPETMLGDTAVAVHPEDERYRELVGRFALLPLVKEERKSLKGDRVSRRIPIIADRRVKKEFGTGAVKVTPAHDPLDFEIGKEHHLPFVKVIDERGIINENGGDFEGLERFKAREEVVKKLKELGLLSKVEKIRHSVGKCYRCKSTVEPLVSVQWFFKVSDKKIREPSLKVVLEGIEREEERLERVEFIRGEAITLRILKEGEILLFEEVEEIAGRREDGTYYLYYQGEPREVFNEFYAKSKVLNGRRGNYEVIKEGHTLKILRDGEVIETFSGEVSVDVGGRILGIRREERPVKVKETSKVNFIPKNWENFYKPWIENLKDWCISRQIWWGHRIPVWYCKDCKKENVFSDEDFENIYDKLIFNLIADGKIREEFSVEEVVKVLNSKNFLKPHMSNLDFYREYVYRGQNVGISESNLFLYLNNYSKNYQYLKEKKKWRFLLRCKACGSTNLKREEDVLDTWFSSALWPFGVFKEDERRKLFPTDLLITGFDIIFFWVARMIFTSLYFYKVEPFKDVYIHALIRDEFGRKMSKTLGNVIDPLDIIEKYGADSLRFTLASLTVQGRDIRLSEKSFESAKHFANKLWNASRFVIMNTPKDLLSELPSVSDLKTEDRWIITLLNETVREVNESLKSYEFSRACQKLYDFVWNNFCDWYIEMVKGRVRERDLGALYTLNYVLDKVLRLLHPFMPFITEEIWDNMPTKDEESLALKEYPTFIPQEVFKEDKERVEELKDFISTARYLRSVIGLKPSQRVKLYYRGAEKIVEGFEETVKELARLSELIPTQERPKNTVAGFGKSFSLYLEVPQSIDLKALKENYKRRERKVLEELRRVEEKLSNEEFLKKAPKEVVEKNKRIREELRGELEKIRSFLEVLDAN